MKSRISNLRYLLLLCPLALQAALPPPAALSLSVNTNGSVIAPLNFFSKNAPQLEAVRTNRFAIVYATDQQYLTNSTRAEMSAWVITHQTERNIRMVLTSGDVVDTESDASQWANSTNYWHALRAAGIPHLVTPGNHDFTSQNPNPIPPVSGNYATFYGSDYYSGESWFNGGFYSTELNGMNSWMTQRICGRDWLFISLEWGPRTAVMDWAYQLATNHPNHSVIVTTHIFLQPDGLMDGDSGSIDAWVFYGVHGSFMGGYQPGRNNAVEMWNGWLRKLPNLALVLSGHHLYRIDGSGGEYSHYEREFSPGRALFWGDSGNPVWSIMGDYQGYPSDVDDLDNGWFRILTFDGNQVSVETYSTTYESNKTGNIHSFTIDLAAARSKTGGTAATGLTQYRSDAALSSRDLLEGLWFYAPCNELQGTNVLDVIGGHVGIFGCRSGQSITTTLTTNAVNGRGLKFLNQNFVNFGNVRAPYLRAFSGSCWYKGAGAAQADGIFISRHNGGTDAEFSFSISTGNLIVTLISASLTSKAHSFALPLTSAQLGTDDAWHHYGFVYDGVNVQAYFDGMPLGAVIVGPTGGPPLNTSDRDLMLGDYAAHGGGEEFTLYGYLDEVMLWDRALSARDMQRLAAEFGHPQRTSTVQTLTASSTIYVRSEIVRVVGSGGAVTLTSTPSIPDGVDGQKLELWGTSDSNTVTIQDNDTLAGSNFNGPGTVRLLGLGDVLTLRFNSDTGCWHETAFTNN